MEAVLDSFEDVARAMMPVEDFLFGVRLETETVGAQVEDEATVDCSMSGMFFVKPKLASFRLVMSVEAEALTDASVDVATNYLIPEGAVFSKKAFFEFANSVAGPHMRSYAQQILDGLLTQMKLPARILPPLGLFDDGPFKSDNAPDLISADDYGKQEPEAGGTPATTGM